MALVKKDAMMAQNLKLLGFTTAREHSSAVGSAGAASSVGASSKSAPQTTLHPNMFDRPNEKMLFRVLYFLLLEIQPQAAQVRRGVLCGRISVSVLLLIWFCVAFAHACYLAVVSVGVPILLANNYSPGQNEL